MLKTKPNREKIEQGIVNRVHIVKGHLNKIEEMVTDKNVKCQDILVQLHAIKCSINAINEILIVNHFKNCVYKDHEKCPKHDLVVDELVEMLKRKSRN